MVYNYYESVRADVENYYKENAERFSDMPAPRVAEEFHEVSWELTGLGQGSYTCNAAKAREYLEGNEELLEKALLDADLSTEECIDYLLFDPEMCDCYIRVYILPDVALAVANAQAGRRLAEEMERLRALDLVGGE